MSWLSWNFADSAQTQEILEHATPKERRRWFAFNVGAGSVFGACIGSFIASIFLFTSSDSFNLLAGLLAVPAVLCYFAIVPRLSGAYWRMLCHFEWAREQGITPEILKLQGR